MSVIDSINQARQQGATEDQIVAEIAKQNPAKAMSFESAQQAGADSKTILDEILKQNAPAPLFSLPKAQPVFGRVSDIGAQASSGAQQFKEGLAQASPTSPNASLGNLFSGVGKVLAGASSVVTSPLAPLFKPVATITNKVSGAISDIPDVQSFAQTSKGVASARVAEDIANYANAFGTIGGVKVSGFQPSKVIPAVKDAYSTVTTAVKNEVLAPAVSDFNKNLNKALPVLKKDVKNLPIKQKDALTAFTDIVQNRDTVGILDSNGQPKNPSSYTFTDTVDAQTARLKQTYADYTSKLDTVEATKFNEQITSKISDQVTQIATKLAKENSVDVQRALGKIKFELSNLRDTSPIGIQNYIETIGQKIRTGGGQAPTLEQIQYANLGGALRDALDTSIEKFNGKGYQDLRNVYKAHKTVQSQLIQAAKSQLNKTPGWTDRMANLGMTAEGVNFLLTHDPSALAVGVGIKFSTMFTKWLRSPQRALQNMFKEVQRQNPPLRPDQISQTAKIIPSDKSIPKSVPQAVKKSTPEDALTTEARKYKTAEEFVKAQTSIKANSGGFSDGFKGSGEFNTAVKELRQNTGEKIVKGKISIVRLKPTQSTTDFERLTRVRNEINSGIRNPIVVEFQKPNFYDVMDGNTRLQVYKELGVKTVPVVINKSGLDALSVKQIKTSSQLTEIWNKSHRK